MECIQGAFGMLKAGLTTADGYLIDRSFASSWGALYLKHVPAENEAYVYDLEVTK